MEAACCGIGQKINDGLWTEGMALLEKKFLGAAEEIERLFPLVEFAERVMRDHRAQLPSETRDLYGGGCGCPQCEQARTVLKRLQVNGSAG